METSEYIMVMPFLIDSVDWVAGFECGTLYERMKNDESVIENYFHTSNLNQIEAMAEHFNYEFNKRSEDPNWALITMTKEVWPDVVGDYESEND